MSVYYRLNKKIKVKDLKEKGFTVLTGENAGAYQLVIESKRYYTDEDGNGSWVGTYDILLDNVDETELYAFEGHTGFAVIWEICELFNAKYFTDEDMEYFIHEHDNEETLCVDELFDKRMKFEKEKFEKNIEDTSKLYAEVFGYNW